jgi:hypothetical protein
MEDLKRSAEKESGAVMLSRPESRCTLDYRVSGLNLGFRNRYVLQSVQFVV